MPHTRSKDGKREQIGHKREKKWLEFLQANIPSLCHRLHAEFSKEPGFHCISIFTQTKRFGSTAQHSMFKDGGMAYRDKLPLEDFRPTANAIDCYIWFHHSYDKADYRCLLPFHILNDNGIHFKFEDVGRWGSCKTPYEMGKILYTWIQDTIRGELCRRRSQRMKKELVAAVWHPTRVSKWIDDGVALEDL